MINVIQPGLVRAKILFFESLQGTVKTENLNKRSEVVIQSNKTMKLPNETKQNKTELCSSCNILSIHFTLSQLSLASPYPTFGFDNEFTDKILSDNHRQTYNNISTISNSPTQPKLYLNNLSIPTSIELAQSIQWSIPLLNKPPFYYCNLYKFFSILSVHGWFLFKNT